MDQLLKQIRELEYFVDKIRHDLEPKQKNLNNNHHRHNSQTTIRANETTIQTSIPSINSLVIGQYNHSLYDETSLNYLDRQAINNDKNVSGLIRQRNNSIHEMRSHQETTPQLLPTLNQSIFNRTKVTTPNKRFALNL